MLSAKHELEQCVSSERLRSDSVHAQTASAERREAVFAQADATHAAREAAQQERLARLRKSKSNGKRQWRSRARIEQQRLELQRAFSDASASATASLTDAAANGNYHHQRLIGSRPNEGLPHATQQSGEQQSEQPAANTSAAEDDEWEDS